MIPFLTYPLALIALATVPALAAIYILRNRFRRRSGFEPCSVALERPVKSRAAREVHRLQLPLLFSGVARADAAGDGGPPVHTGSFRNPPAR